MAKKNKLITEELKITIFNDGKVAFTNVVFDLIDVALKVNPQDKRILKRKAVRDRKERANVSQKSKRD